jgi:hypothetical protein
VIDFYGAQGRNRTTDTVIFSHGTTRRRLRQRRKGRGRPGDGMTDDGDDRRGTGEAPPGGPLPLALGCPATCQGSPSSAFRKEGATSPPLPIRYPQRYPGRGFAP